MWRWLRNNLSRGRDGRFSLARTTFMALLTGGMSLLVLAALEAPAAWDRATLRRADWLLDGRKGIPWGWLGRKWIAALLTAVGILPVVLGCAAVCSLALGLSHLAPGQPLPRRAFVVVLLPVGAVIVSMALVVIQAYQTLALAAQASWGLVRRAFARPA